MHEIQPEPPPAQSPAALIAIWEHPRGFHPFFDAAAEGASHDFLVAVPRPDLIPQPKARRSETVYTVDLP